MIIKFNLSEHINPGCAFYALYAGLRMYKDKRQARHNQTGNKDGFSVAAAEAYCLLVNLKENHPEEYKEAEEEYNRVYSTEANN